MKTKIANYKLKKGVFLLVKGLEDFNVKIERVTTDNPAYQRREDKKDFIQVIISLKSKKQQPTQAMLLCKRDWERKVVSKSDILEIK